MALKARTPTAPRRALITGASQGLGRALVEECAARGMDLLLVALPGSGLSGLSRAISKKWDVSVDWLEADLTDPATHERLVSVVRSKKPGVDLLINNAGIGSMGFFTKTQLAHHEATIDLNVIALMRLTRLLIPELTNHGSPHILNVASLSAFFPMPYFPVYSATKSFVVSFSLALRDELAGSIGVSVLCPNTIRTDEAIQSFIDRLGIHCRLACLTPQQIARTAMKDLVRDKAIIVPGFVNRLLRLIAPFVPRAAVVRVIHRYWGEFIRETKAVPQEGPRFDARQARKRRSPALTT